MSIEMHVFFRGKLPSKAALSRAMKELDLPFTIKPATGSLEQQHGYMPMLLRREETGVEFDVYDDPSVLAEFADVGVDPSLNRMASFRWAGDMQEMVAGICCAAALAKLVNGVVFDAEEGKLRSVSEAIAFASDHLKAISKADDARRPGTRPADIKRYLKPLLRMRSDLVLVGRHLLIRPVRHLLRGALLDRTGDRYSFQIWRYIKPLYEPAGYVGSCAIHGGRWTVYEPYFEPLLLDSLGEDVFDDLGQVTTLPDIEGIDRFIALVLWGRIEEATEILNDDQRRRPDDADWLRWIEKRRGMLTTNGISALCEEYHAKEAETAKAMKLGDAWEPSPFPVEVIGADREGAVSEPVFVTTPWIDRPPNLWQEMPEAPGEICFASFVLDRKGRKVLWMPLTVDEAEARHKNYQGYVLAARLANRAFVCLSHSTAWSPYDPVQPTNPNYVPRRDFHLNVYGPSGRISASIDEDMDEREVVTLDSVTIYGPNRASNSWHAFNSFREQEISIHDSRHREQRYSCRPMTNADRSLCRFPLPSFGDYCSLLKRVRTFLRRESIDHLLLTGDIS